jgi:hypothetical protein
LIVFEKVRIANKMNTDEAGGKKCVVRACATVFYYWVTWAPLTRGSAATGYAVMYGLLLACGYTIQRGPPNGIQADWEAILRSKSNDFVKRICNVWLLRPNVLVKEGLEKRTANTATTDELLELKKVPNVMNTITTLRQMLEVLNVQEIEDEKRSK